ncbi:MAG: carbon-nitrogen hydrolase family protein [Candidatus Eremiobacteraeota bacterium]|nr:carbon-nitrogen hydrolase family protein [Candidatus Eremiobacteraeota bacterium]NNM93367.1 carbon-nitrogen hydrolase family protein [Candidatus Eremiobacteraeota bacterium]
MSSQLRVAALQLQAHDRSDFVKRWPAIRHAVERSLAAKPNLLLLPEATIPAYIIGETPVDPAQVDEAVRELSALARRFESAILTGTVRIAGDRQFNAALLIDRDGSIAGYADKFFLWHFDRRWFTAGERIEPIDSSLGKIGALVCADGRIPTVAATLVERGAQILAMPTAWVTSGRDPNALENLQADLLAVVRARENRVPFVAANKSGGEAGIARYCGKSTIVAADGSILARAAENGEETILATVEIEAPNASTRERALAVPGRTPSSAMPPRRRVALASDSSVVSDRTRRFLDAPDGIDDAWEIDDAALTSPFALVEARMHGMRIYRCESDLERSWCERFARARSSELRCYGVVVHRPSNEIIAVDPEGAILTASGPHQRIISFGIDLARTDSGELAPSSDALAALARVERLRQRSDA